MRVLRGNQYSRGPEVAATVFAIVIGDDTTNITLPNNLQDGDIGILFDNAERGYSISAPSPPSGWTSLSNTEINNGTTWYRSHISFKQLTAVMSGGTVTGGMNSTSADIVKTVFVLRPTMSIGTVTLSGLTQQIASGAEGINQQTITHTIGGLNLHFAVHRTQSGDSISDTTFTPTKTGQSAVSGNREIIDFLVNATADSVIDNGTSIGTFYALSSMEIKLS